MTEKDLTAKLDEFGVYLLKMKCLSLKKRRTDMISAK